MAGGLLGIGQQEQNSALSGMGAAASLETSRNNASEQLKAQHTQNALGMTASGAAIGAMATGGPWGALIGAGIGFIAGELM